LRDTVYTGWRELEVHTADLALAPTSDDWSHEFCLHLLDFLRPRTPGNTRLVLRSGETTWANGTGEPRVLVGKLTDLTAWLAGRTPQGPIYGDLPELKPWP
jgi:maleylpyruvate isomerase